MEYRAMENEIGNMEEPPKSSVQETESMEERRTNSGSIEEDRNTNLEGRITIGDEDSDGEKVTFDDEGSEGEEVTINDEYSFEEGTTDDEDSDEVTIYEEDSVEENLCDEFTLELNLSDPDYYESIAFNETLDVVSENGLKIGNYACSVELADLTEGPSFVVHVSWKAELQGVEFGENSVSYVTKYCSTLLERRSEYLEMMNYKEKKNVLLLLEDDNYFSSSTRTINGETESSQYEHDIGEMEDFFGEGATIILLRYMAMNEVVAEARGKALLMNGKICDCSFDIHEVSKEIVYGEEVDAINIIRTLSTKRYNKIWTIMLTKKGQILMLKQDLSNFYFTISAGRDVGDPLKPIPLEEIWEEDMQLRSLFQDKKGDLLAGYKSYLADHPEFKNLLSDFLTTLLERKPKNAFTFAVSYFSTFDTPEDE